MNEIFATKFNNLKKEAIDFINKTIGDRVIGYSELTDGAWCVGGYIAGEMTESNLLTLSKGKVVVMYDGESVDIPLGDVTVEDLCEFADRLADIDEPGE